MLTLKSVGACAVAVRHLVVRRHFSQFRDAMTTVQQKAQCVLWYAEFKSPVLVQRNFRRTYRQDPPTDKTIVRWFNQFKETGSVDIKKSPGRPRTSEEDVERLRQSCVRSPKKSIARRSLELGMAKTTVQNILHKRLKLHAYKIQLKHEIKPADKPKRVDFAVQMLSKIDDDENYLDNILFSDEATFHISGCVNRHNCRIWGNQQPNEVFQYVRDTPKVNVWCGLMQDRIIGPFMFAENTITGTIYLDMLEMYVFPQIDEIEREKGIEVTFQQDGAPCHYSLIVQEALNNRFPDRWIGRNGPIMWPPRSPDLTPLDFFFWGYVKNLVYAEKIRDLQHLRERIYAAITTVTPEMLQNTWREVDYRLDVCRATGGAHIETF